MSPFHPARTPWRVLFGALILAGCLSDGRRETEIAGGSTSTETGKKVNLSGLVRIGDEPVPGVRVALLRAAVADTTDSSGAYHLYGISASDEPASPASPDTLTYGFGGKVIAQQPVFSWKGVEVPEVRVAKHTFVLILFPPSSSPLPFRRIEGVVKSDDVPGDSMKIPLTHDENTGVFSGVFYLPAPEHGIRNYLARLYVYSYTDSLVGRSPPRVFTNQEDTVSIPPFNPTEISQIPPPPPWEGQ